MAAPIYDTSAWPIFQAKKPTEALLDYEFAAHVERLSRLLTTERRFALLIDARGANPLNAKQRAAISALHRKAFERDPNVLAGVAVVLSSAIERGIMTAITWAAGPTFPTHAFATLESALAWLQAQLGLRNAGE